MANFFTKNGKVKRQSIERKEFNFSKNSVKLSFVLRVDEKSELVDFRECLLEATKDVDKLLSKFYNTDLLIYLNISIFDISNLGSWHWILYNSIKNWVEENKLDFDICNYNNIFILDSNGSRLFKIYPIYELIYTHDDKERIYRLT